MGLVLLTLRLPLVFLLINACQSKKTTTTVTPGEWSAWGPWGECSKTCGIGVSRRSRICSYRGRIKERKCKGHIGILKNCDTKITCPIDGGWSSWEAWKCTATCGGGDGAQKRSCTNPKPMFGGKDCEGPAEEKGKCNTQKCPDEMFTLSPMTAAAIKSSLDNENHNFEKIEGDSVRIPCSPSAVGKIYDEYPKTALMWTKNGKILKIDHDRMFLTPAELMIKKLNSKDNGVYACSVHYAPQVVKPVTVAAIAVTSSTPDIHVPAEESMKLICHGAYLAKMFKNATQKWLLNGKEYKDFGSTSPYEINVYEIEEVKKNMSGKWSCRIRDPITNREWTTNVVKVDVLPPIPRFLKFLSNRNLLLTIGIMFFIFIMFSGTVIGYVIINIRENYMKDFEKWCQIVEWEEIKAGGVPEWALKKENEMVVSEESESNDEI